MPSTQIEQARQPLVLALDIGTSSVRALLFDRAGRVVQGSETQIEYDLTATPDGGAFVDADLLVGLTVRCIDGVTAFATPSGVAIGSVGISTFWHGLLGLDPHWKPTTPVLLWADTRSALEVEELRATVDRLWMRDLTGCVIHSSYWPAKLRWLQRTEPDAVKKTSRWCSFSDYLLWRLTGADCTSVSMASGTGLLDVRAGDWAIPALEIAGIGIESLPLIAPDGTTGSCFDNQFGSRWPALADACWLPAYGDGACANAGTNSFDSSRIALSLGTSGAMRVAVDAPSGDDFSIPDDLWAYRLDHQRVVFGAALSNGGKVLSWFNDLLGTEFDGAEMAAAADMQPDAHGLTVLPFLAGERSPIWNDRASAVVAGLTLSTGRAEVLRAGMEAVSLRFARLYTGLKRAAAAEHRIVANGAALLKSPTWLQITADALDHPIVTLPPEEEVSARGAAVLALLHTGAVHGISEIDDPADGAGVIQPIPDHVERYKAALDRQTKLEYLLFPGGGSWQST